MSSYSFSMSEVFFTVNNFRIDEYSEGGGIDFEPPGEIAEEIQGPNGTTTKIDSNDRRVHLTANLQRSQEAFDLLHGLIKVQLQDPEFRFPVSLVDLNPDSSFAVTSPRAYFVGEYPSFSIGDGPGESPFTISLPRGLVNVSTAP